MTKRQAWGCLGVTIWLLSLSAVTSRRLHVWHSDFDLWTDAAAKTPGKPRPVMNEGRAHELRGDTAFADQAYRRTISLTFDERRSAYVRRFTQAAAETNLAHLAMNDGRFASAMRILDGTLTEWPDFPYARYNRAAILWVFGACDDAIHDYVVALHADASLPSPKGQCQPRPLATP